MLILLIIILNLSSVRLKATSFNAGIANNNFKSFKCKAKVLGNTEADKVNEILIKCNSCCAIKIFK